MVWFKVDDNFAFHPKTISATNAAIGLWVRAGSWSGANLTGGRLPAGIIGTLGGHKRDARKLVEVGLWDETDEGYRFRNWDEFQPTKAQVDAEREANRVRQAEYRARKRNAVTNTVTNGATNSTPTRPDPTRPKKKTEGPVATDKRGTRVPDNFALTPEMKKWAAEETPAIDVAATLAEFIDYWRGVPGQRGVKLDWESTWRNAMRKQQKWALERGNGRPGSARPGDSLWDLPATGTDR